MTPSPPDRMTAIEDKVDKLSVQVGALDGRVGALETRTDHLASEMRMGFRALEYQIGESEQRTRAAIRESEDETRRQMRVLHEEVLDRIAKLGEGRAN